MTASAPQQASPVISHGPGWATVSTERATAAVEHSGPPDTPVLLYVADSGRHTVTVLSEEAFGALAAAITKIRHRSPEGKNPHAPQPPCRDVACLTCADRLPGSACLTG